MSGFAGIIAPPNTGQVGAPSTGSHVKNELWVDSGGTLWVCTVAGVPGTWVSGSGGGGPPSGAAGGSLTGTYPNPTIAASIALPGSPTTTKQSALDNSTKVATTSYADSAVGVETTRAEAAEALLSPLASPTFTGIVTMPALSVSGLTGAIAASRYVGRHDGAAPTAGTFLQGDWTTDVTTPAIWICTAAGTPGTWAKAAGGGTGAWNGNLTNTGYLSPGATYQLAAASTNFDLITISQNITISPWSTPVIGDTKVLHIGQNGTGGWTVTFSGFVFPNAAGQPSQPLGANSYATYQILYNGFFFELSTVGQAWG